MQDEANGLTTSLCTRVAIPVRAAWVGCAALTRRGWLIPRPSGKWPPLPAMVRARFLVLLAAAVVLAVWCPFRIGIIRGRSMEPTLVDGRLILVNRSDRAVRRGDVVALYFDGVPQVKRVFAVPGDKVWEVWCRDVDTRFLIAPRDRLFLNAVRTGRIAQTKLVRRVVPEGAVYVLGDNGKISEDSRHYGLVPTECVVGKVLFHEGDGVAWTRAYRNASIQVAMHTALR